MVTQRARLCLTLLLIGWSAFWTAVAVAQSLALDYELTLRAQAPASTSETNDPCNTRLVLSVGRCTGEGANQPALKIRQNGTSLSAPLTTNSDYANVVREHRSDALPDDVSLLSKPRDVTLRLASRYRFRYNTDISDTQRFVDARYEAWAQRNELNAVGVELLFPFH